jgi:hypothetical protein
VANIICYYCVADIALDLNAQPYDVGRAVHAVDTACGFLSLARLLTGGLPLMDPTALMALVDQ